LKITQVNPAFLKLTGYEESAVLGQHIKHFIQLQVQEKLDFVQTDLQDIQAQLQTQHGSIPIALNCSCLNPEQCDFKGKVIVARPIGALLTAYETLKKANQELADTRNQMIQSEKMAALGRLVSGIAHELNTPISILKGNLWSLQEYFSELAESLPHANGALEDILDDSPQLFEDTHQALQHITTIVQSLKTFSQPKAGKLQVCDLVQLIRTALNWVQASHTVNPKVHFALPETFSLMGQPQALQQVLMNLLQNALDAMKKTEYPELSITLTVLDNQCQLSIEDNGTGIAEEDLPHIFDPFFSHKPVGEGTGLGLSISQNIIESMQGQLTAWNRPEGGAVFQITLPMEAAHAQG